MSCATGTGAALIASTGAAAHDRWDSHYVEVTGRLKPSANLTSAGSVGVGISNSSANTTDSITGAVTAIPNGSQYVLTAGIIVFIAGVQSAISGISNALINVADAQGFIPLTIGLLVNNNAAALTVNGKVVQYLTSGIPSPSTTTHYPFLLYEKAATGTATCYLTNLVHMTRFTTDGPSTAAAFGNGTITTRQTRSGSARTPAPRFYDVWSSIRRENFYWRYTPRAYVIGSRTLGTVDFAADPGTDLGTTKKVVFSRDGGNLVSLQLSNNADPLSSGGVATGLSTPDGGGQGFWRDIGTMTKYGIIEDQSLAAVAAQTSAAFAAPAAPNLGEQGRH